MDLMKVWIRDSLYCIIHMDLNVVFLAVQASFICK